MAMPALDLTGQKFGYLTVLRRHGTTNTKTKKATWLCRCDCGNKVVRISQNLRLADKHRPNAMPNCGCMNGETVRRACDGHGMTETRQWCIWRNMKSRCLNPKDKDWANYGGRGISICETWAASFETFWQDMQDGYEDYLTIERIDVNGPYTKSNCRWATVKEQGRNKRDTRMIDTPLGRMPLAEAAECFGLKYVTLYARYKKGHRGAELFQRAKTPAEILEMMQAARWPSTI